MFVAALLCQVILATAAFAIPTAKERLAHRVARRAAGLTRQFSENTSVSEVKGLNNATPATVVYSNDWTGAFLSEKTATYNGVTGTFVIPTLKAASGASGSHEAAAWVGIDGATCTTTLLQTGVDSIVNGSSVSHFAWYQWYPAGASYFEDITFEAGDTVTVTVAAMTKTTGTVSIKNHRTGKRVLHNFTGQAPLCKYDAEWVVGDLGDSSITSFANFGTVTFTNATAHTLSGKTVGPANAEQLDLIKDNKAISKVTTGANSVTITYTGQ